MPGPDQGSDSSKPRHDRDAFSVGFPNTFEPWQRLGVDPSNQPPHPMQATGSNQGPSRAVWGAIQKDPAGHEWPGLIPSTLAQAEEGGTWARSSSRKKRSPS